MRIVKHVGNWKNMDGDNELEKRINSFLALTFAGGSNLPSNECLDEARGIIYMLDSRSFSLEDMVNYLEDELMYAGPPRLAHHALSIVNSCISLYMGLRDKVDKNQNAKDRCAQT